MSRENTDLAARPIFTEPRPEHNRESHCAETADGVDHRGTGKVDVSMAEIHRGSKLRHPAAAPRPASGDGIEDRSHEKFAKQECPERNTLTDCANNDVASGFHEYDFEKRQAVTAAVVCRPHEEETLAANESPLAVTDQEMIERRDAAEIGGSSVDRDRAELKGIADGVVREEGEYIGREVQHHQVRSVFLADQSAREQREPGLHKQDEVSSIQRPCKVGGDAYVSHTV